MDDVPLGEPKSLGRSAFSTLISSLSETSKKDLVDAFLDSLQPYEQRSLLENLSARVDNGVRAANETYHYLILHTGIDFYLCQEGLSYYYYDACDNYIGDSGSLQIMFTGLVQETIHTANMNVARLFNPHVGTYGQVHEENEAAVVYALINSKNKQGCRKLTTGLCFKVSSERIVARDPLFPEIVPEHRPMQMELVRYFRDMSIEAVHYNGSPEDKARPEVTAALQKIGQGDATERLEFTIEIDGQQKRVLYLSYV